MSFDHSIFIFSFVSFAIVQIWYCKNTQKLNIEMHIYLEDSRLAMWYIAFTLHIEGCIVISMDHCTANQFYFAKVTCYAK